jgi:hypothetical protein
MPPRIGTIERRSFAGGQVQNAGAADAAKIEAAARGDMLGAIGNLAQAVGGAMARRDKLNQLQFESDAALLTDKFAAEADNVDFDKATPADILKNYQSELDKLGNAKLTHAGYDNWQKDRGYNFKENASLKLGERLASAQDNYNGKKFADIISEKAALAVNNPALANGITEDIYGDIDDIISAPAAREILKQKYRDEFATAKVMRDVEDAPALALERLGRPKENYDGLSAVQVEHFRQQAERRLKAIENTALNEKIKPKVSEWINLYNTDYARAVKAYEDFAKALGENQTVKGLTRQEAQTAKDFMQKVLSGDIAYESMKTNAERQLNAQRQLNFAAFEADYEAFKWDKKTNRAQEKDLATPANIIEKISQIEEYIAQETFGAKNNDALAGMRARLDRELGLIIIDDGKAIRKKEYKAPDYIATDSLGRARGRQATEELTNESYIRQKLNNLKKTPALFNLIATDDKEAGAKNLGYMWRGMYKAAAASGVNLKSATLSEKKKIDDLFDGLQKTIVRQIHGLPPEDYQKALVDENIAILDERGKARGIDIDGGAI